MYSGASLASPAAIDTFGSPPWHVAHPSVTVPEGCIEASSVLVWQVIQPALAAAASTAVSDTGACAAAAGPRARCLAPDDVDATSAIVHAIDAAMIVFKTAASRSRRSRTGCCARRYPSAPAPGAWPARRR